MKTPKTLVPYVGKNIELSLRDIGYGHCTVLSANKESATVRWYGFCPRYDDQYYGRDRYEEPYLVPNERIASVRPSRYNKAGLLILRDYYLEQDKPIFRKFEQTVRKRQETIKIAQRLREVFEKMSEDEQKEYMEKALFVLDKIPLVPGGTGKSRNSFD